MTRILVIDNYDSFVYTLNGYLQELGAETEVVRNDDIDVADVPAKIAEYDGVLISPGPGKPADAGVSIPVVEAALATGQPILGVCLGHQAIAEAFGAVVTNAEELMHGKTSRIEHDASPFYDGVPQPFTATRYHSLAIVDGTMPPELVVTSRTQGGVIMGLKHVIGADLRRAVPPRIGAHRGRLPHARQLARRRRTARGARACRRA